MTGRAVGRWRRKLLGTKLTHAVGLSDDLAAFADTDGGAVLIERVGPDITDVASIEAPGKPYGLAYDAERRRLYVTLTATNQLQVVDLADPAAPRIIGVVPTVQQPNSVAVDPRSGAVLVTGSNPDGTLQIVTPDLLPRRLRLRATPGSAWPGRAGRSDGWPQARARRPLPARPRSRCRRRPNETTDRPFATTRA